MKGRENEIKRWEKCKREREREGGRETDESGTYKWPHVKV